MITMAVNVEEYECVYIVIVAMKFYKLGLNHIFPLIVTHKMQLIKEPFYRGTCHDFVLYVIQMYELWILNSKWQFNIYKFNASKSF